LAYLALVAPANIRIAPPCAKLRLSPTAPVVAATRGDGFLPDSPTDSRKLRRIKAAGRALFPLGIATIPTRVIHNAIARRLQAEDMARGISKTTQVSLSTIERATGRRR
jgi:hypothetical protein